MNHIAHSDLLTVNLFVNTQIHKDRDTTVIQISHENDFE